jgi:hypothetical protein
MKRSKKITAITLIAIVILAELTFLGIPFHYSRYTPEFETIGEMIDGFELSYTIRSVQDDYFLDHFMLSKANLFNVFINFNRHTSLFSKMEMKKVEILEGKNVRSIMEPDKHGVVDFEQIPENAIMFEANTGGPLNLDLNDNNVKILKYFFVISGIKGSKKHYVTAPFKLKKDSGWRWVSIYKNFVTPNEKIGYGNSWN